MNLTLQKFKTINLSDPFFDSLKNDYAEFCNWFARKAEDSAYVFSDDLDAINGFLYLKVEDGLVDDTVPPLSAARRLKVGTLKINAHGTKLGERFIKKIFDHAIHAKVNEIYVTVFSTHASLIGLLERYGFVIRGTKTTTNGTEQVLIKEFLQVHSTTIKRYPIIELTNQRAFLLSLKPEWHTRLLPDSILATETPDIVQDISHTNSIHKVYLTAMNGIESLNPGDALLIYRTSDGAGPAHYRSVGTSICVVEEYRSIHSFENKEAFLNYCRPYSVFTEAELATFWTRKNYPHVIRFTYNVALNRRVTRGVMIEEVGLDASAYWGFLPLTHAQFIEITNRGMIDESLIIH